MKFRLILILLFYSVGSAADKDIVEVISKSRLQNLIENRNGNILVLNIWATWCIPCREEIPDLVKISNQYKNVEVVGLSVDYPDEIESKILPFLKENKVSYKIFVNGFKNDSDLISFLNTDWNGALPATIIFDSKGKQRQFITGKKKFKEFQSIIEKVF